MYIINHGRRTKAVFLFFTVFFALSATRLLYIQFFRSKYLESIAGRQHYAEAELEPRRGTIYDTTLKPQAVNISVDSVYASPREIPKEERNQVADTMAAALGIDPGFVRNRINRNKSFIWIARKISPQQSEKLKQLNLKGVGFVKESRRCYPNGFLFSQVLGFAGLDNTGLEGLELLFDRYLKGEPGKAMMLRDARSKKLDIYDRLKPPKDGSDLILTVDEVIQYIAERELNKAVETYRARGGSVVVMRPSTGEILALANRPTFDPNSCAGANKDNVRNRALSDLFEPGSVFKIVTASAALEEKKVTEHDRFFCENGEYKVGNHILHDHRPHGWLTFKEVIEQSSNIGTCKVAQKLGAQSLCKYIELFGFGKKTGIDLPGEISGMVRPASKWSKTSISAVPMGQEVGVTALQLACAVSAIANGGVLMKPYIVREIRNQEGRIIKKFEPSPVRQVISPETAARVRAILIGVIETGTGKMGKMDGFTAGGKTGTAQKLEPNGTYSHSKFVASFIGFAPGEDPQIAVVVTVDEPRGYYFGGVVSAPVFKTVSSEVLKYLKSKESENRVVMK